MPSHKFSLLLSINPLLPGRASTRFFTAVQLAMRLRAESASQTRGSAAGCIMSRRGSGRSWWKGIQSKPLLRATCSDSEFILSSSRSACLLFQW